jgi:hypothetical protein
MHIMDSYMLKYDSFKKKIVYDFRLHSGGIGDCIKFFMYALMLCMKHDIQIYYLVHNIPIEKYLKLKFEKMYITENRITEMQNIAENDISNINTDIYNIITPFAFYDSFNFNSILINFNEVFKITDEVKINSEIICSPNINDYISIHLRLGDQYLETDHSFVQCKYDTRSYNEDTLCKFIEDNCDKPIIFFCDNNSFKLKIKNKYNNLIITTADIGHTSFYNTTDKQALDALTEFFLMSNSVKIISASYSGFPIVASKFKNIPLIEL